MAHTDRLESRGLAEGASRHAIDIRQPEHALQCIVMFFTHDEWQGGMRGRDQRATHFSGNLLEERRSECRRRFNGYDPWVRGSARHDLPPCEQTGLDAVGF